MIIKVTPAELPSALQKRMQATVAAGLRGMFAGAQRGRTILVRRTPKDRGQAKRGWRVRKHPLTLGGMPRVDLYNDAPYVGVLESGARPHSVSKEGFMSILGWVHRHDLGQLIGPVSKKKSQIIKRTYYGETFVGRRALEADVAMAIVRKLKKYGQKALYFVLRSLPDLQTAMAHEVDRAITKAAGQKNPPTGGI